VLPFSVLVDQRGVVSGYGQLWNGLTADHQGRVISHDDSQLPSLVPQISKLTAKEGPAKAQETKEARSAAGPERGTSSPRAVASNSPSPQEKKAAAEKKRDDVAVTESRVSKHPVTITGVARNNKGEPIAKATVYLLSTLYDQVCRVAETTTDARGRYAFRDAPLPVVRPERNAGGDVHGAFEILGVADGYGFAWRPRKVFVVAPRPAPGEDNYISQPHVDSPHRFWRDDPIELNLEFPAASQIKGRIVDEQGRPVAGVKLDMRLCERIHDEIETGIVASAKIYDLTALN
jgi:protocatechuate 3,4-dioxygenase beta subunit